MRIELIHPVTVHFAIGLLVTGVFLSLGGAILRRQSLQWAGQWALWVGACFGVLAVIFGSLAEDHVSPPAGLLHDLVETHSTLAWIALAIFALVAAGWLAVVLTGGANRLRVWLHVLGLAGVVVILLTGLYGGRIVYEQGGAVYVNGTYARSVLAAQRPEPPPAGKVEPQK